MEKSHEEGNTDFRNIDARDQRDGGWSWIQDDIYTVFLPLIGREATHLYQVMTYLIPQRIRNPIFDLTIRKIAEVAAMSTTSVHRNLKVLHAVGMMPRVSSDPPMFVLADLRKLAKVGRAELAKRLEPLKRIAVPQGNNREDAFQTDSEQEQDAGGAQSGAGSGDLAHDRPSPQEIGAAVPEASDARLVPQGNKDAGSGQEADNQAENLWKTTEAEHELVPQEGILVPEKGGVCSPIGEQPYIEVSTQSKNPHPTLPGGEGAEKTFLPDEPEKLSPPDGADAQLRWTAFKTQLKREMYDVPIGVEGAKKWKSIRDGEHDFIACFSAWWLIGVERRATGDDVLSGFRIGGAVFYTCAGDEAATAAGIAKYRKRLTRLCVKFFNLRKDELVDFQVQRAAEEERAPEAPAAVAETAVDSAGNGHTVADAGDARSDGETRVNAHGPNGEIPAEARLAAEREFPALPKSERDGETHSDGESQGGNGEIPAADRAAWEQVQRLAKEHLARMAKVNGGIKLEWAKQALDPARLESVETAGGKRVWKLLSPQPATLRIVLELLSEPVLRMAAAGVEIEVIPDSDP